MQFDRSLWAALAVLVLAVGCATTQTEVGVGMDTPGRPEVTWHSDENAPAAAPTASSDAATESKLLVELDAEEEKGTNQLAIASTLYNLAILRRQQGSLAEAERLYRKALTIREKQQGPNHPDVAVILNNLAALKIEEGAYDEAQPLLERALSIRQTALGGHDPLTAQSLNNLALLHAAQGDTAAAEPLYQQALVILEQPTVSGQATTAPAATAAASHAELARVLDNYAALLHDTGRDSEAEALEARARHLQPNQGSAQ